MNFSFSFNIKPFTTNDYKSAYELWERTPGLKLRGADSKENGEKYLRRNPNSSFIVYDGEVLVGTILAGHDGKRGYISCGCG